MGYNKSEMQASVPDASPQVIEAQLLGFSINSSRSARWAEHTLQAAAGCSCQLERPLGQAPCAVLLLLSSVHVCSCMAGSDH